MAAVAELLAAGRRRRAHPRQRPPGRQPAGQERARRRRRPARAARLVRRADPGHARLHADERPRRRARRARDRAAYRHGRDPHPGRRRTTPGFTHPTKPIGRYLPGRGRRAARRPRRDLGGPRREGLAPGRRLAGAAGDPRRRRRARPGGGRATSSSPTAAAASPWCARTTARCAASRPSSTRTSARRCSPRTVGGRRAGRRDRRTPRGAAVRHPDAEPIGTVAVSRAARARPSTATSPAARWARRWTPPAGSSSRAAPAPSSPSLDHIVDAVAGNAGTVVVPD